MNIGTTKLGNKGSITENQNIGGDSIGETIKLYESIFREGEYDIDFKKLSFAGEQTNELNFLLQLTVYLLKVIGTISIDMFMDAYVKIHNGDKSWHNGEIMLNSLEESLEKYKDNLLLVLNPLISDVEKKNVGLKLGSISTLATTISILIGGTKDEVTSVLEQKYNEGINTKNSQIVPFIPVQVEKKKPRKKKIFSGFTEEELLNLSEVEKVEKIFGNTKFTMKFKYFFEKLGTPISCTVLKKDFKLKGTRKAIYTDIMYRFKNELNKYNEATGGNLQIINIGGLEGSYVLIIGEYLIINKQSNNKRSITGRSTSEKTENNEAVPGENKYIAILNFLLEHRGIENSLDEMTQGTSIHLKINSKDSLITGAFKEVLEQYNQENNTQFVLLKIPGEKRGYIFGTQEEVQNIGASFHNVIESGCESTILFDIEWTEMGYKLLRALQNSSISEHDLRFELDLTPSDFLALKATINKQLGKNGQIVIEKGMCIFDTTKSSQNGNKNIYNNTKVQDDAKKLLDFIKEQEGFVFSKNDLCQLFEIARTVFPQVYKKANLFIADAGYRIMKTRGKELYSYRKVNQTYTINDQVKTGSEVCIKKSENVTYLLPVEEKINTFLPQQEEGKKKPEIEKEIDFSRFEQGFISQRNVYLESIENEKLGFQLDEKFSEAEQTLFGVFFGNIGEKLSLKDIYDLLIGDELFERDQNIFMKFFNKIKASINSKITDIKKQNLIIVKSENTFLIQKTEEEKNNSQQVLSFGSGMNIFEIVLDFENETLICNGQEFTTRVGNKIMKYISRLHKKGKNSCELQIQIKKESDAQLISSRLNQFSLPFSLKKKDGNNSYIFSFIKGKAEKKSSKEKKTVIERGISDFVKKQLEEKILTLLSEIEDSGDIYMTSHSIVKNIGVELPYLSYIIKEIEEMFKTDNDGNIVEKYKTGYLFGTSSEIKAYKEKK